MRLLERLGHKLPLRDLVVRALVPGERVVGEERAYHAEGLVPDLPGLSNRDTEGFRVVPGRPPTSPEVQAAVRQDVERGRALGDPHRVVAGQDDYAVAEPDAGRPSRQRCQENLRRGAVRDLLVEVVLRRPVVVETDLLG